MKRVNSFTQEKQETEEVIVMPIRSLDQKL